MYHLFKYTAVKFTTLIIFTAMPHNLWRYLNLILKYGRYYPYRFGICFQLKFKVFRVLCGEWVEPCWDCMYLASPGTCIVYFLLITFVANFMVFNLFIAILLEQFDAESLKSDNEEKATKTKKRVLKNFINGIKGKFSETKKRLKSVSGKKSSSDSNNQNGISSENVSSNYSLIQHPL